MLLGCDIDHTYLKFLDRLIGHSSSATDRRFEFTATVGWSNDPSSVGEEGAEGGAGGASSHDPELRSQNADPAVAAVAVLLAAARPAVVVAVVAVGHSLST